MAEHVTVDIEGAGHTSALAYRAPRDGRIGATLVLAHGAGAGQSSAFIVRFATGLASRGLDVLTFNFLYTEQKRKVPDRTDKLEACYRAVIGAARAHLEGTVTYIGGKSMGGRIASHLAAADDALALGIHGLVCLGYPLHPPGKPDQLRVAHWPSLHVPALIVQGERDAFGTPEELRPHVENLAAPVTLLAVRNGDHSLAPPKKHDPSVDDVYDALQDTIATWAARHRDDTR